MTARGSTRWAGGRSLGRLGAGAAVLGAVVVGLVVGTPVTASAHPLGNFTVNRYSGIVVAPGEIRIEHVLDLAEIPTAQRAPRIDLDNDGRLERAELSTWAGRSCAESTVSLLLTVDGTRVATVVTGSRSRTLPGQAGLPILRIECDLRAAVEITRRTAVRLEDSRAGDEVGWREMTARGDGTTLVGSDVPQTTRSKRLTAYPKDLLKSPLDVRAAALTVRPGGARIGPSKDARAVPQSALPRGADRLTLAFQGLLTRTQGSPLLGIVALLGALALGAGHALVPGHGKTIMAFYLSGRRERALRSAATVGATVTATHTVGVLALGLLVSAGTAFVPARVYPWLSVVSGLLVVVVGLALLRGARHPHTHDHPHGHPHDGHSHSRPDDHLHPQVAVGDAVALVGAGAPAGHTATVDPFGAAEPAVIGHGHSGHDHEHSGHDHGHGGHDHGHGGHDHEHSGHDHGHGGHDHGDDHESTARPTTVASLVAMGMAGGLVPSPSALLVFLGALGLGQPWFGVALVVAFGLGMAGTLAVVGVLVMKLRHRAEARLRGRPGTRSALLLRLAPVVTACAVVVLGAVLAYRGLSATGSIPGL